MSDVFSDFMINQHVNSQVELQKVIAERDTLISVLKECVVALEIWNKPTFSHEEFLSSRNALTHAKSTLSKYER